VRNAREEVFECDVGVGVRRSPLLLVVFVILVPIGLDVCFDLRRPMCGLGARTLSVEVTADVVTIESACEEFAINNAGLYPDYLDALIAPSENGQSYLRATRVPSDPWGRAYHYEAPACVGDRPRIWTRGRDGVVGGEGEDQDIGNWMLR